MATSPAPFWLKTTGGDLSRVYHTASVGCLCVGQLALHMALTMQGCVLHHLTLRLGPQIVGALQTRALDSAPAPLATQWPQWPAPTPDNDNGNNPMLAMPPHRSNPNCQLHVPPVHL
jgi:hypothetical protein